jgi:TRAP-type C4-dicarboxylate transport system substrate-binding protein
MANAIFMTGDLDQWAREVEARSGETLHIKFANGWRMGQRDLEAGLIHDVQAAKVDIGWVGSRALPTVGVNSFDALHAPFVIDSYALEEAVMQSRIPDEMLAGLRPLGVVGLGVLPGPLRRPLSVPHPLRSPADYARLRIGYQGGAEPAKALRALGARPVQLAAGAQWRGIDAIEQQAASIDGNGYYTSAKYLTANVVLWPRPMVLFINRQRFATLTRNQQQALTGAAHHVVNKMIAVLEAEEHSAVADMCPRGIRLVSASAADIERLRAATAPLLAHLERQPDTRLFLTAIIALRQRAAPVGEQPLQCPRAAQPSASGLPDGDYTTRIAPDDAARELANIPRRQRTEAGLSPQSVRDILHSEFTLSLRHGSFVLYQRHADGYREAGIEGTYSLFRDRFIGTGSNGDILRARWSFDGTNLRFSDFSFPGAYRLVWASEPWNKSR